MKIHNVPFESLRNSVDGQELLKILFRAGRYTDRIDSKDALEAYRMVIRNGQATGKYTRFYEQARTEYYKPEELGGIPRMAKARGPKACVEYIKKPRTNNYTGAKQGKDWSHINDYNNMQDKTNHRSPDNGFFEDGHFNKKRKDKPMTDWQKENAVKKNKYDAYKDAEEAMGPRKAKRLHKKLNKELTRIEFEIRLQNAIRNANKAGIIAALTSGAISMAWNLFKLYPSYKRGEITKREFTVKVLIEGFKAAVIGGASAWIITFISTLCPPIGIILGGIGLVSTALQVPAFIKEFKDILDEYKDLYSSDFESFEIKHIMPSREEIEIQLNEALKYHKELVSKPNYCKHELRDVYDLIMKLKNVYKSNIYDGRYALI